MNVVGRRAGLLLLICTGLCVFLWSTIRAAADPQLQAAMTRKAYADKTSQTYSFPFAAHVSKEYGDSGSGRISLPGNAAVEGNTFIEPGSFPDAAYCGHCHQEAYHEWRQALHSNSFRTPFYRTSVNILIRTKGIEFARQ